MFMRIGALATRPPRLAAFSFNQDFKGMSDEAHIPAEQPSPRPSPRFSHAHGNTRRTRSDPGAPGARPQEAQRLIILTRRADFLAANAGRRVATPGFVLLVHPRRDDDPAMRIGFTVTKKIGNAVVRNRMKRRLRSLARTRSARSWHTRRRPRHHRATRRHRT